jgi:hypothetical protein
MAFSDSVSGAMVLPLPIPFVRGPEAASMLSLFQSIWNFMPGFGKVVITEDDIGESLDTLFLSVGF